MGAIGDFFGIGAQEEANEANRQFAIEQMLKSQSSAVDLFDAGQKSRAVGMRDAMKALSQNQNAATNALSSGFKNAAGSLNEGLGRFRSSILGESYGPRDTPGLDGGSSGAPSSGYASPLEGLGGYSVGSFPMAGSSGSGYMTGYRGGGGGGGVKSVLDALDYEYTDSSKEKDGVKNIQDLNKIKELNEFVEDHPDYQIYYDELMQDMADNPEMKTPTAEEIGKFIQTMEQRKQSMSQLESWVGKNPVLEPKMEGVRGMYEDNPYGKGMPSIEEMVDYYGAANPRMDEFKELTNYQGARPELDSRIQGGLIGSMLDDPWNAMPDKQWTDVRQYANDYMWRAPTLDDAKELEYQSPELSPAAAQLRMDLINDPGRSMTPDQITAFASAYNQSVPILDSLESYVSDKPELRSEFENLRADIMRDPYNAPTAEDISAWISGL